MRGVDMNARRIDMNARRILTWQQLHDFFKGVYPQRKRGPRRDACCRHEPVLAVVSQWTNDLLQVGGNVREQTQVGRMPWMTRGLTSEPL